MSSVYLTVISDMGPEVLDSGYTHGPTHGLDIMSAKSVMIVFNEIPVLF